MRIAINAPAVRSLSANEKMVYQFLKDGLDPFEIARKMHLPVGKNSFSDNRYDVPTETITRLITSIREKGWDIPGDNNKEEKEMAKLTEEAKREIVQLAMTKAMTHKAIAEKFGISKSMVWYIVDRYKKSGETAFEETAGADEDFERMKSDDDFCCEVTGDTDIDAEEIACELNGTPPFSVNGDTDIEAYNKAWDDYRKEKEKEPVTAATDTSSEQNIIPDNSTDIVPENAENVKSFEGNSSHTSPQKLPDVVLDACFLKGEELRSRIAEEEQYIRILYEQLQELEQFVEEHGGNDNEV